MDYQGKTIRVFNRYIDGEPYEKIFICDESNIWLTGNAWNGRWKCDKRTGRWYHYVQYLWRAKRGEYIESDLQ